jgi:hypothetical protein
MSDTPKIIETKNYIPPKKKKGKKSKNGKKGKAWIIVLASVLAVILVYAVALYMNESHIDSETGLRYRMTSLNTCHIVNVGECKDTEIKVPEKIGLFTVTEIEAGAFSEAEGLKRVEIPATVTKIGMDAFYGCKDLEEVTLPEGITEIAERTFDGCESLAAVAVPKSVTKICPNAFTRSGVTVTYPGTAAEWEAVKKDAGWCRDIVIVCTDGTVDADGNPVTEY